MADMPDLKDALKQALTSPMRFAFVAKGAGGTLLVAKKVPDPAIKAAQKELGSSTVWRGRCHGEKGVLIFEVAHEAPPALADQIKRTITKETGAAKEVEVRFNRNAEAEDDGTETAETAHPHEPLKTTTTPPLDAGTLMAAMNKLTPAITHAAAANPARKADLLHAVANFQTQVAANQLAEARETLLELGMLIKSSGPAPGEIAKGTVAKRQFLLTRWKQIPAQIRPEVDKVHAAIERDVPEEDADEIADALEAALQVFYDEMQAEIDTAINAGNMKVIEGLKKRVLGNELIKHLVTNPMVAGTGFQTLLIQALDEVETNLAG